MFHLRRKSLLLLAGSLITVNVIAMPKQYTSKKNNQPAIPLLVATKPVIVPTVDADKKVLAKKLLTKVQAMRWAKFNWTALYTFFRDKDLLYSDFLKATRNGDWQAISNLANLLAQNGSFNDPDLAMFYIFSVLNSYHTFLQSQQAREYQDNNVFVAENNQELLGELSQAISELTTGTPLEEVTCQLLNPLAPSEITHLMQAFSNYLWGDVTVASVHLVNTLGNILTVLETECNLTPDIQPNSQMMTQCPTVSTVLGFFNSVEEKQQVLAFLIGCPFDNCQLDGEILPAETGLHSTVAQSLQPFWASANEPQQLMLAQLAIQVFHFNFLEPQYQAQACPVASQAAAQLPVSTPGVSLSDGHAAVRNSWEVILGALDTPSMARDLIRKLVSKGWTRPTREATPDGIMALVLNQIQNRPGAFEEFIEMLRRIAGMEHVVLQILSALPGHGHPQPMLSQTAYPIASAVNYDRLQGLAATRGRTGCTELYGVTVIKANLKQIIDAIAGIPRLSQALLTSMVAHNLLTHGTYTSLHHMSDHELASELIHRILAQVGIIPGHFVTFIKMLMEQLGCQDLAQHLISELERLAVNPPFQARPLLYLPGSRI